MENAARSLGLNNVKAYANICKMYAMSASLHEAHPKEEHRLNIPSNICCLLS